MKSTLHYRRVVFSSQVKSKVGNILVKTAALRINLSIDGVPTDSRSHTHPSHSQTSRLGRSLVSFPWISTILYTPRVRESQGPCIAWDCMK